MTDSDNNAWVFDSLVGFLHGPVWNVPLQTFIEEKSLPFEPSDTGEVYDRPEYKKIHDEYRNLVDVMLGSFMDDIGITADQFEAACRLSAHDLTELPAYFHKRLFEQIWAANDYDMFVKMMTHKNVELQLQQYRGCAPGEFFKRMNHEPYDSYATVAIAVATFKTVATSPIVLKALELIERRYGAMPSLFSSESEDLDTSQNEEENGWQDNDDVMTEIKKLQLKDIESADDTVAVPPEDVVAEKHSLLSKLQTFDNKEEKLETKQESSYPDEEIKETKTDLTPKKKHIELPKIPVQKVEVSEEEVRARQEYLKQQRDKLLALKKQVREKQLVTNEASSNIGAAGEGVSSVHHQRPRSARMAQAALKGKTPQPPPDAMQLRRALASKLKSEVVDTRN